jgi:hypothetical protein
MVIIFLVRFKVLASSLNMTTFWNIAPCSLVEVDRRFRDAYCLDHQDYASLKRRRDMPEWNRSVNSRDSLFSSQCSATFSVPICPHKLYSSYQYNIYFSSVSLSHLLVSLFLRKVVTAPTSCLTQCAYCHSIVVEWFTLLVRIWKAPGSNLVPETGSLHWDFSWFSSLSPSR